MVQQMYHRMLLDLHPDKNQAVPDADLPMLTEKVRDAARFKDILLQVVGDENIHKRPRMGTPRGAEAEGRGGNHSGASSSGR